MRKPHYIFSILFMLSSSSLYAESTKDTLELLDLPAYSSKLANKSIVMSLTPSDNGVIAVGERGHILLWQSNDDWQQEEVPVSVAVSSVTILSDGSKIAVGHDSVILKSEKDSSQWRKVFTGWELTSLKIDLLKTQQTSLEAVIENTKDEDELDELTYKLDDIIFGIEDTELEKTAGPNQPLLSVARTNNDTLFAIGAYGLFLTSLDKGATWQLISDRIDNPDKFHLNDIIYTQDNQLFIVAENGLAFNSTDNGVSWSIMEMPYSGSLFGIISNDKAPKELVAFGLQGNLMVSIDSGKSWQYNKLPTSASLLGGTFLNSGQAVIVGHGGRVVTLYANNMKGLQVQQHPSGAALSSVVEQGEQLVLGGQYGIEFWQPKQYVELNALTEQTTKNNNDK